jgi:hypothetical protein
MRWELSEFYLDDSAGTTKTFNYAVSLKGADDRPQFLYKGEGLFYAGGAVELSDEEDLHELLRTSGINAQQIVEHLSVCVRSRAEKLMRQRMAHPAAPTPSEIGI